MTSRAPWWRASPGRAALIAAAVAALVYLNALGNGFAYDDVHIVVEDDALASLASLPERLVRPWWPDETVGRDFGLWRPVTTAALGLQRAAVGLEPAFFHAVNVALHALVTALVVLVAVPLVGTAAALAGGLVFAVHPVHVEAVANVVGLAELLAAVFYLGACLLFLRRTREPEDPSVSWATTGLLCGLFALAFLSKEAAATLPAALVVLDLVRRPVSLGRVGGYLASRSRLLAGLAATGAVVLGLRAAVLGTVASADPPLGAGLLEEIPRIWTLGVIWLEYLRLLFVPATLSVDYSPDVIPVLTVWTPRAVAGVAAVLAILGAAWYGWRRSLDASDRRGGVAEGVAALPAARLPAFAVAWFMVTVAPVSNVLFLSGVLLAERTLYLPSVGVAVALGAGAVLLLRRSRLVGVTLAVGVLALFSLRSWTRTATWESTDTVFRTLIVEHPRAGRGLWTLGDILDERGEREEANAAYREALSRLDSPYRLLMELGWDAVERGDHRLGEYLLTRARETRPDHGSAWRRLTILYGRQERHEDVVATAREALRRIPDDVVIWHLLGSSLAGMGRWPEAIEARRRVIALGEDPWQQWFDLARLELTVGDTVAARRAHEEALRRAAPGDREALRDAFAPYPDPPEPPSAR